MASIQEPARNLEVIAEADVVVAGGGPGGWPAAVAASRQGMSTVLIERYGFLGGMATAGLIGPVLGHTAHSSDTPILGGIPREMCETLHKHGGAPAWNDAIKDWGVRFEPEIMKVVLDEMVAQANVQFLLHSWVADALVENDRIRALVIENKSGRQAVIGKAFIDATGDADVAFRAGVPTHSGRPQDGRPMAMGSMFKVGGVQKLSKKQREKGADAMSEARESGELLIYNPGIETRSSTTRQDYITPNMTRHAGDPTDAISLTQAEITVRREMYDIVEKYRDAVPGYEDAHIAALPTQIGLRESRQIEGLYTFTGNDVVESQNFDDVIALGSWWIDIHCPLGKVTGGVHVCRASCPADPLCDMLAEHKGELPDRLRPDEGEYYDIPFRSLVPRQIDNLLVSGRCISADNQGMAGTRVMGTCMAIGEAAGTAAALAADRDIAMSEMDISLLQAKLEAAGALLGAE
ncbi:MAG: FAD-dependent oxidoreductase [Candidatus Brocadiia bacterium]